MGPEGGFQACIQRVLSRCSPVRTQSHPSLLNRFAQLGGVIMSKKTALHSDSWDRLRLCEGLEAAHLGSQSPWQLEDIAFDPTTMVRMRGFAAAKPPPKCKCVRFPTLRRPV